MASTVYKLVVANMVTKAPTDQLEELKEKWSIMLELITLELESRKAMGTKSGPVVEVPLEAIEEMVYEPGSSG